MCLSSKHQLVSLKHKPRKIDGRILCPIFFCDGGHNIPCKLSYYLNWLSEFERSTRTHFIVDRSMKEGKCSYSADKICHFSDKNKNVKCDSARYKTKKHKSTGCKSRLTVRIKRATKDCLKRDPFAKKGLLAVVEFKGNHNHAIDVADAQRFLPPTSETKQRILDNFHDQKGPSSAMHDMRSEMNEDDLASASVNPNKRTFYALHDTFRLKSFGGLSESEMIAAIERNKDSYESEGVYIQYTRTPFTICKCKSNVNQM